MCDIIFLCDREDTITKRKSQNITEYTKGEIPITKNVRVVDSQGNEYEATYPKRANGLVKKGRARFIDENTICLACPPNEYLEDIEMSENKNIDAKAAVEEIKKRRFTMEYVLEKIDELTKQLESVDRVANCISSVSDEIDTDEPEIAEHWAEVCSIKAAAIREVFTQREANLRKLLDYYIELSHDLKSNNYNPI